MDKIFITDLMIENVRHLKEVHIPLSGDCLKHLIITGKNGSGKTSVLNAMAAFLNAVATTNDPIEGEYYLQSAMRSLANAKQNKKALNEILEIEKRVQLFKERVESSKQGVNIKLNYSLDSIRSAFEKGEFILAYYQSNRTFQAEMPKHVEKIELKDVYKITETPRENFVKYLLDLKMTEALAAANGKKEKADKIKEWFRKFEDLLRRIFDDKTLNLEFDEDTFAFYIHESGKESFDFNTLSSGYAAVLDIAVDMIIRMEKQTDKTFRFDMPGIVLIDEIETHLHLELQKKIMDLLTTVFPNVQFVVSTHSPFILNSLENVIIYDLENCLLVENGLADIPYEGIVEGYFQSDSMSDLLKGKYEKYKILVEKEKLSDEEIEEIAKLELFLDEIPDYLALDITTEYRRLKLEYENREDI